MIPVNCLDHLKCSRIATNHHCRIHTLICAWHVYAGHVRQASFWSKSASISPTISTLVNVIAIDIWISYIAWPTSASVAAWRVCAICAKFAVICSIKCTFINVSASLIGHMIFKSWMAGASEWTNRVCALGIRSTVGYAKPIWFLALIQVPAKSTWQADVAILAIAIILTPLHIMATSVPRMTPSETAVIIRLVAEIKL